MRIYFFVLCPFCIACELLLPELNGNVVTSKLLPLPPINYKAGDEVDEDDDVVKPGNTWCVEFPTSGWSQFCTLWKRMILQLYRNKVDTLFSIGILILIL
jgi:hypothetical protein